MQLSDKSLKDDVAGVLGRIIVLPEAGVKPWPAEK
jgi:hypothetical protein